MHSGLLTKEKKRDIISKSSVDGTIQYAGMAELADALDSGSSRGSPVEVQVLLPAPQKALKTQCFQGFLLFCKCWHLSIRRRLRYGFASADFQFAAYAFAARMPSSSYRFDGTHAHFLVMLPRWQNTQYPSAFSQGSRTRIPLLRTVSNVPRT